jgi:hypothetical protein
VAALRDYNPSVFKFVPAKVLHADCTAQWFVSSAGHSVL